MKRSFKLLSIIALAVSVSICCLATSAQARTYRLATHCNPQHPSHAALERIVQEIDEKTNGDIKIKIYPSGQLGDYTVTYEDLMKGAVDMALIPIPSEFSPQLEMNFIPYLASGYGELEKAVGPESYFYKTYTQVHDKLDVKLLGIYVEGLIGLAFTKMPENYTDPEANKELRVRAPAIEVYNLVLEDMGFNATTIPYADLYSALQTGVVDGAIGLTPQLAYSDFRDVIKYYIPYNIFVENIGFLMSKEVFEGLSPEYQKIVEEAFMKEARNSYKMAEQFDNEKMKALQDYGVEIVELDADTLHAYAKSVQEKTWPKLSKNIGEDNLKALIDAMK